MPFYTFITKDEDIEPRMFQVQLSFVEYDEVMESRDADDWCSGANGPVHPNLGKRVTSWQRILDPVNYNFTNPKESSRWDNFEYRAAYNLFQAQEERRKAEQFSHMGTTPIQDQEKQIMGDKGFDLGERDMNQFEGQTV